MITPISIPKNIAYIESFGPRWIQAVLLRKVDLALLERNRIEMSSPRSPIEHSSKQSRIPEKVSFFNLNFTDGEEVLMQDPRVMVANLFAESTLAPLVLRILSNAKLSAGDLRWRTELRNAEPSISGNDDRTIHSLGALAHELGHCLYEISSQDVVESKAQILSEASAMALEEWVVSEILPLALKEKWNSYQRQVDAFNDAFYYLESGGSIATFCEPHLLPLRESFYTAYGYQTTYRLASRIRSKALARQPRTADALLTRIAMAGSADLSRL